MSDFKPRFLKPKNVSSYLDRNEYGPTDNTTFIYNKNVSQTIEIQRKRLPIFNNRSHILYLLEKYQSLILVGETGCGKSTQIPQVSTINKLLILKIKSYTLLWAYECGLIIKLLL